MFEFSGYPSCRIDRASTQYDPSNVNVVVEANRVYPTVDVSVEGHWSNDGKSVIATSLTRFLTRAQGLSIAYVLVADSLTGSSSQWTQRNFYSGSSSNDPDLQAYCEMGSTLPGTVFNDVAVAASYDSNGNNLADALTHFGAGNTEENTYTLALPTSNQLAEAINKDYVYVVAIVTNADGTIANAAKAKVAHMNGIAATNPDRKFDIYSLDGTPVRLHATSTVGLRPGIYVIHDRMDGTMEGSHVLIIK